jgi:hypothetical protein
VTRLVFPRLTTERVAKWVAGAHIAVVRARPTRLLWASFGTSLCAFLRCRYRAGWRAQRIRLRDDTLKQSATGIRSGTVVRVAVGFVQRMTVSGCQPIPNWPARSSSSRQNVAEPEV